MSLPHIDTGNIGSKYHSLRISEDVLERYIAGSIRRDGCQQMIEHQAELLSRLKTNKQKGAKKNG